MSDATCTGLQLANFWQDVSVDIGKGRIYLPLEVLERHGSSEREVLERRETSAFTAAMREAAALARRYFEEGLPLSRTVDRRLSIDIELFSRGGLCILDKIEEQGFRVLSRRPRIGKAERVWLLLRTAAHAALRAA
jgi:phytoene/squalene synthetase